MKDYAQLYDDELDYERDIRDRIRTALRAEVKNVP